MPNDAQIEHWNGPGGEQWAQDAARYDRLIGRFGDRVVEAAAVQPGERVLDIGCGTGSLALALGPVAGTVLGVDISAPQLEVARRRAAEAGLSNVEFVEADAQVYEFEPESFDAAVSRFGVMFFDDPAAAFANIGRALRPGGRVVFAVWQEMAKNEWLMVPVGAALAHVPIPPLGDPGAPGPFALADPDRVRSVFGAAGFVDVEFEPVELPVNVGASADDALTLFKRTEMASTLFKDVDEATAEKAWAAIADAIGAYQTPDGVLLTGRAWLLTARRPA